MTAVPLETKSQGSVFSLESALMKILLIKSHLEELGGRLHTGCDGREMHPTLVLAPKPSGHWAFVDFINVNFSK